MIRPIKEEGKNTVSRLNVRKYDGKLRFEKYDKYWEIFNVRQPFATYDAIAFMEKNLKYSVTLRSITRHVREIFTRDSQ